MNDSKYKFLIPTSNIGNIEIPLEEGKAIFVLGANGVGKSTLMHSLFQQNKTHSKRVLAHRQTWFRSAAMNMTASSKKENEQYIKNTDSDISSRWKNENSEVRLNISIFDLINSENIRARNIANAVDEKNYHLVKTLANEQSPLQAINELLALSNIKVTITLGKDEQLFASKNGSEPYSIAELSDGERNALLICADVLTTEPNYLIILDEPERHLHRSIISPLLSSLFQKRKDCVFVISTHDVFLPIDHNNASILLLRSCQWNGKNIKEWDADLISEPDKIATEIKREILGSKREILFVEGNNESLDRQIYQLIFPNVTVIPQENCTQVEKAVEGIKGTEDLHWINAFGLVDADDRTEEQIQTLLNKGIVALECYSVESLYYNLEIVKKIAKRCSEMTGENEADIYEKAISGITEKIKEHKERLCARLCEKRVRHQTMSQLPKHRDIAKKEVFKIELDLKDSMEKEENIFDDFISNNDINALIRRYPIRETPIINEIVKGLGLNRSRYESTVRKLIVDDAETRVFYRSLLSKLTELIEAISCQ